MNQLLTVEVADFVDAVDAALADLPADVRAELLEDLPAHLGDVIAEGGSPRDQLGEPAAYAAELRAAAGYPAEAEPSRRADLAARLHDANVRMGRAIGYERLSELFRALQPAWWVLRGYLATLLAGGALGRAGTDAFAPQIGGSKFLGIAALVVLVGLSVQLGRRWRGRGGAVFVASVAIAIVLSLYGLNVADKALQTQYVDVGTGDEGSALDTVTDVVPYGRDGKVLRDVRLYDQDGNPFSLTSPCSGDSAASSVPLYPLCPAGQTTPDAEPAPVTPGEPIAPLPSAVTPTSTAPSSPAATPTSTPIARPTSTPSR